MGTVPGSVHPPIVSGRPSDPEEHPVTDNKFLAGDDPGGYQAA
jgi:hypothetical protein